MLSVVVPTHGRVDLLENLLKSLQRAIARCNVAVEVIIVDDSSKEEREKIEQLCQVFGATYFSGTSNVREKRNLGVRNSKGKIIFFVDSDCEVTPDIFNVHLQMYDKPDTGGVLGITEFTGKETYTWRIVKRTRFLDAFSFARTLLTYVDSAPWGTCTNLSIKKEILEEVGGFDTKFPFLLGGDDTDLGIRINKAGYKIRMNPHAIVIHTRETWSNFVSVAKRAFRWGRMDYYVHFQKHKEKLSLTFVKPVTVLFPLMFISVVKAVTDSSLIALFLPLAWLAVFLFVKSVSNIVLSNADSLMSLCFEMPAQFLNFLFDLGTVLESIRSRNLAAFFKEPLCDPRQVIVLRTDKVREMWSLIISLLFLMILLVI